MKVESKYEFDIRNYTWYYFDNIKMAWDRDIDIYYCDVSLDEKLYKGKSENILIYGILYKYSTGAKSSCFRYDKKGGFIKINN